MQGERHNRSTRPNSYSDYREAIDLVEGPPGTSRVAIPCRSAAQTSGRKELTQYFAVPYAAVPLKDRPGSFITEAAFGEADRQMAEFEQIPFGASEFAENPEPRCPCLLLLDTSASMKGTAIEELNRGLMDFRRELAGDPLAMKRVELGVVTFGPVQLVSDFQTADQFAPPLLDASGDTPMGAAIASGLEMVRQRKDAYRANGISITGRGSS
jgi:hypothetical protein